MMGWDDGLGAGGWLGMSLMMMLVVAFWGSLIALVAWAVRSAAPRQEGIAGPRVGPTERADEVLAELFARGEIDEEAFIRRRELLHRQEPQRPDHPVG
jgi:putative membrane protein